MKKAIILILALSMVAVLIAPAIGAQHGNDQTVTTSAVINSATGSAPVVKAQWEVPDEDPTKDGVQVNIIPSSERTLKSYSIIRDPNGRDDIMNVYVDVYHPKADGSIDDAKDWFKYQVHATRVANGSTEEDDAIDAGVASGELTVVQAAELRDELGNLEDAYMWVAELVMSYHQTFGWYTASCWATDKASNNGDPFDSYYEWVKTPVLEIDFEGGIEFGELTPSVEKVRAGDYDINTTGSTETGAPSVKNEGNCELELSVKSTCMVGVTYGKTIKDFDAKLADDPSHPNADYPDCPGYEEDKILYSADPLNPSDWSALQTFNFPLRLCHTDKMNFSVHAEQGLPSDSYVGNLNITAVPYLVD